MILRRASPLVHLFRYACSTTIVCRGKKNAKKKAPDLPPLDPVPARVDPCLATLVDKLPQGPDWTYEVKWKGYRLTSPSSPVG